MRKITFEEMVNNTEITNEQIIEMLEKEINDYESQENIKKVKEVITKKQEISDVDFLFEEAKKLLLENDDFDEEFGEKLYQLMNDN